MKKMNCLKKIVIAVALALGVCSVYASSPVFAAVNCSSYDTAEERARCGACATKSDSEFSKCMDGSTSDAPSDVIEQVRGLIATASVILGLLAVVIVILGGFTMMTSAGDPGRVKRGRDTILWGMIGLIVILLATLIVNFVLNAVSNV